MANNKFMQIALRRWASTTTLSLQPGKTYTINLPGVPNQVDTTRVRIHAALEIETDQTNVYVRTQETPKTLHGPHGVVWRRVNNTSKYILQCHCGTLRTCRQQDTHRVWLCHECAKRERKQQRTVAQRQRRTRQRLS